MHGRQGHGRPLLRLAGAPPEKKEYIVKGYLSFLCVQGIVLLQSHVFRGHMGDTDGGDFANQK
jgi:hypothetical protein